MRDKTRKYQLIGLGMIFIMFFSTLGFAALNSITNSSPQPSATPAGQKQIERHTTRALTEQEKAALFKNGVTILEFLHTKDCQKCSEYRPAIEGFYTKYPDILLLDIESDKDVLQFTGRSTEKITNVTTEGLLDAYCNASFVQSKECILKKF